MISGWVGKVVAWIGREERVLKYQGIGIGNYNTGKKQAKTPLFLFCTNQGRKKSTKQIRKEKPFY